MNRAEILDSAKACVCGDREQDYGFLEDNVQKIADLWTAYMLGTCVNGKDIDICIDAEDVTVMMMLVQIARIASKIAKADDWINLAEYAACGGELQSRFEKGGS